MEKPINDKNSFTVDEVLNKLVIMENEQFTYKTIRNNIIKEREKIGGYFKLESENGEVVERFKKENVELFLKRYMRKNEAHEYLNIKSAGLTVGIKKFGLAVVKLGRNLKNNFLLKSEIENYKSNITSKNKKVLSRNAIEAMKKKVVIEGHYNSKEVCDLLKLSRKAFLNCLNEKSLVPSGYGINNMPIFEIEYIKERVEYQENLFHQLNEHYYTYSKTTELFNGIIIQAFTRKHLSRIAIPPILKGMFDRNDNLIMYLKDDVDKEGAKLQIYRAKRNTSFDNLIHNFYYQIRTVYQIEFKKNVQNTTKYWFQFVEQKLNKLERNDSGKKSSMTTLVKCTELLSLKLDKEIYSYTSNQINILLLNYQIPLSYRTRIYQFLNILNESLEELNIQSYNILNLLNPYEKCKGNVFKVENLIYDVVDFLELIDYCSNTSLHKIRAISDVERFLENLDYDKYDSMWLFVIIHLNNAWRHDTVVQQTPRIDLSNIRVDGLNWFKNNDLTFEEAKDIVFQVGRKVINVSKNKSEGNFFMSDKLTIPFATAMCISELRTEIVNPKSSKLIDFGTEHQRVPDRTHNVFFKDFLDGDFKLSSLKMNRTYLSVVNKLLEANYEPVKASQFARSHKSEETTNIYIKFSRVQLDELTSQLFSRDNFGFINQTFTELIFEKEYNREIETKMMVALDKSIGDKYKLEATSGFINNLVLQRQEVERMIRSMTFEEVLKTYRLLMMNELPSKQKHYQCLFSKENCRRPELSNCENCQYSIPNVYAIINLLGNYISQIIRLQNDFDSKSIGQRKKLANQFHLTRLQLKEAEAKFGADIVYGFIDGGRESIRHLASSNVNLRGVKEFVTLK